MAVDTEQPCRLLSLGLRIALFRQPLAWKES